MIDTKRPDKKRNSWVVVAVLLVLLLILYVASIGPAAWLANHNLINPHLAYAFYLPVRFIHDNCEPIRVLLDWYVGFWSKSAPLGC